MDEPRYQKLADEAYAKVAAALDALDPDKVDCDIAGDVVTLTFANKKRCILNTQRATQQLWLAADARAWHFAYDEAKRAWMDDKGQGNELYATLARIVKEQSGEDAAFA